MNDQSKNRLLTDFIYRNEHKRRLYMSMIRCPECGTKISELARVCPYCGFQSEDRLLPISKQDSYKPIPLFQYDIEEWNPCNDILTEIPYEDNKELYGFFGKWSNIVIVLPELSEMIKTLASRESYFVADYDAYVANLIKKGTYRFLLDKKGRILPSIYDGKKIVQQVRLRRTDVTPQLSASMSNLLMHMQLARIIDGIEYLGEAINHIHRELHNERIASSKSARDKLLQAKNIHDTRMRERMVLEAISKATDAKNVLMCNFSDNLAFLEERSKKSTTGMVFDFKGEKKDPKRCAEESFQDLVAITNAVQVECEGYSILREQYACQQCLCDFRDFIKNNGLDKRDTLLKINENLKIKNVGMVNQFIQTVKQIDDLSEKPLSIDNSIIYLDEGD